MLTRSVSHLAFGKDDVSCLDMPTRHTRTSRGTEASALLRCRGRDGKRLARGAEAACLAAGAKPANPRSRRRTWILFTRTHGQVSSVDRCGPGVPRHLRRRLRRGNPARNGGAVCRSPECCAQIVAGSAELLLRFERSFENAFGKLAPIIRAFACLQFFRKYFFRSGSADCGHRFDLKLIGNLKLFARALVIESFHPMHHQPLMETLQREVL